MNRSWGLLLVAVCVNCSDSNSDSATTNSSPPTNDAGVAPDDARAIDPTADGAVTDGDTSNLEAGTTNDSSAGWAWPPALANTGPAPGTVFTTMAPRDFTSADSGKTFDGVRIEVGNGQEFSVLGNNITFKNCIIRYTGTVHSPNGFLFIGKPSDTTIRTKNVVFDHCIIDAGDRHEYNVRAYYGQFEIRYSQVRGGSHNIDSGGDMDPGTTTQIVRNYIYDYNNNPFAPGYKPGDKLTWGHAASIYFTGNNGTVNIEDNTIIGNRWQQCNAGWSSGPGAGCFEFDGTGAVVVYAQEDPNPDKTYIVKHNQISAGSYAPLRFYGENNTIQSIQIIDNVFTAQAGWPTFSIEGDIYAFDAAASNRTISGNRWGSDTTCFTTPSACKGSPNTP